jgi:hypothetical protein
MIISMARPKKDPSERKTFILRIPMTEDQKKLIMDAVSMNQIDMAAWARPILLRVAKQELSKDSKKR